MKRKPFAPFTFLGAVALHAPFASAQHMRAPNPSNAIAEAPRVSEIAFGNHFACARLANGVVRCWGHNAEGETGDRTGELRPMPIDVSEIHAAVAISAHGDVACALVADGTARCWGDGREGALGDGRTGAEHTRRPPMPIDGVAGITQIAAGGCAVVRDGTVRCWGSLVSDAMPADRRGNARVIRGLDHVRSVALGSEHGCALIEDGTVRCWGDHTLGQAGAGAPSEGNSVQRAAVAVNGLREVTQVAAGADTTCAVTRDGALYCWGSNEYSQQGEGTNETCRDTTRRTAPGVACRSTPTRVAGVEHVRAIAIGTRHACALHDDGVVSCWGDARTGALGPRAGGRVTRPPRIDGLEGVVGLAAGDGATCAVLRDGSARCWGDNTERQVDDGPAPMLANPRARHGL